MPDRRCLFLLILFSANITQAGQPAPKQQELFASYWTSEPGWDTELQIKNNLASGSLAVTPVLRLASAQEIPLDPVTIAANDSASVWVNIGLLKHSPNLLSQPGSYGSVVFRFSAVGARNVFASSVARLRGGPIEFYNEAHPVADVTAWPRAGGPGSQEGIWTQSRSSGNDFLIVSNSSGKLLPAKLWLSDAAGKRWGQSINLVAYQTQRLDFHDLLRASGLNGAYGGITVDVPANAGALHSLHVLYDEAAQTSQLLKMVARDPAATLTERIPQSDHRRWTSWAPLLPLQTPDPALTMPAGTVLNPTVLVRNTMPKATQATLSLTWHGEKEGLDGGAKVQDLHLAPYETRQIQIAPVQKQLGIPETAHWATFELRSPGLPDDVMAVASSYDSGGRYGTEVTFADNIGNHFAGGEWRADATHSGILAVTNAGSRSTQARVTLHYDKGEKKYEVQRTLKPGQQIWLRLADLIRNQLPDRNGTLMPADLSTGTYEVQDIDGRPGSLLVSSLASDNTFGSHIGHPIPECCGINVPARFSPSFFDIPPNDLWNVFDTVANDACTSAQDSIEADMISFWTTNSSIAQMTASGVKGLVVGSTTGEGESDLIWIGAGSNCVLRQVTPTASITVSDLNCTSSVTRGGTATCTVTPSSVSVSGWQFKDGGGNIVKRATNTGSLTWSGVLVTGGTVSVTPTGGSPLTAAITVNPRNWHTATPSPVEVPNSTFITLPVPPQPTGSDSGLGEFQETYSNPGSSSTFISDNGPNQGYGYYSTQITFTNNFKYEINPDLENTGSTFYSEQCGNYNAQTKPSGFISGSLLLTQTRRHEYNSAVQSHYAFYSNSISGTNNPGNYAESRIASPGTSPSTFDNTTSSGITTRYQNILTAAQVEPYAVNEDANGMFLGNINYAPYISCN